MKDRMQNGRIGSALIAAVVLSACLAVLSVWLGLRLNALRGDLTEAMEANEVLQHQLSMAADTVAEVSTRLGTLRQQMDMAPATTDTSALDPVPVGLEAELTELLSRLHRDGQAAAADAEEPQSEVVRRRMATHRRSLAVLLTSNRDAVLRILSKRTGYREEDLVLLLDVLSAADGDSVERGLVRGDGEKASGSDD